MHGPCSLSGWRGPTVHGTLGVVQCRLHGVCSHSKMKALPQGRGRGTAGDREMRTCGLWGLVDAPWTVLVCGLVHPRTVCVVACVCHSLQPAAPQSLFASACAYACHHAETACQPSPALDQCWNAQTCPPSVSVHFGRPDIGVALWYNIHRRISQICRAPLSQIGGSQESPDPSAPKPCRPSAAPPPPRLDIPGQWRGPWPSSVWTQYRAVKQGHSGGSVGPASQGKGRVCR